MKWRGFTLIELMVVMAIIATLMAIVAPRYFVHIHRAEESALRETLFIVRDAIDKFHGDVGRYPMSLDELVEKQYLRGLPADPMSGSSDTWSIVSPPGGEAQGNLYDLHTSNSGISLAGTPYADW